MQGGGKKKIGTVDHLLIVNNTLNREKRNKKSFHIVFLDVEKAYDKAWLQGILDVLYRNGLQDRQWCYFMKLNEDNKAVIDTHVGDTREISIKNTLRQGSALSGIAYSALTDEIAKECEKQDMGYSISDEIKIPCLLWVDDYLAMNKAKKDIQKALDVTNNESRKYRIIYGESKSKVLSYGKKEEEKLKGRDHPEIEKNSILHLSIKFFIYYIEVSLKSFF